jgi:protein-L-isoaspartate O-methyltransferase
MDTRDFAAQLQKLAASVTSLAALGMALERRAEGTAVEPELQHRLDVAVDALGGLPENLDDALAATMAASVYATLATATRMLSDPEQAQHSVHDPKLLASYGTTSAVFADIVPALAPNLHGLSEGLAKQGSRMLDVGVGVAEQAMAIARAYPTLSITGIDVSEPAMLEARKRVSAAGLSERIKIVRQDVGRLEEDDSFDLIKHSPTFIPEAIVRASIPRLLRSLRPGGWLLFPLNVGRDDLSQALMNLRTAASGGYPWTYDEIHDALDGAGFIDISKPPAERGVTFAAARKSPTP